MVKQVWCRLGDGQKSNYQIAYVNARLYDPLSGLDMLGTLITKGVLIEDIGENIALDGVDRIIDCKGHMLIPGLVDIHVHFREPGYEHKEDIESGSRAAAAGGVTTVVCQPNTSPWINNELVARYIKYRATDVASVNVEFYAAVTSADGTLSDMGLLKKCGALGFTNDGLPVMDSSVMREALCYTAILGVPLAQHAEDLTLSCGGCINEGVVSADLGLKGIPDSSESIMVGRDVALMKYAPEAHYHVLHISSKESLDIVRKAKLSGMHVTCEVTPHHFLITEEVVRCCSTLAKMNPPLRTEADRIAMIEGLCDGTIDCIATDHAPHETAAKDTTLDRAAFGIVGLETMLALSLQLYHDGLMPLRQVLAKITYAPADIVKLSVGRLVKGGFADIAVIDLNYEWVVNVQEFASKSKNSPFHGRKVKGRCLLTIVRGKIVYSLDSDMWSL